MSVRFDNFYSGGTPQNFYDSALYQAHDAAPSSLLPGTMITERNLDCSFILLQASGAIPAKALVEYSVPIITNTGALTYTPAPTPAPLKGAKGRRVLSITQAGVTVDQYAGGTIRPLTNPQHIYQIQGNTASNTETSKLNEVQFTLTSPLLADIANDGDIRIRGPLKATVASPGTPNIALGMSLLAIPDEKYFFAQQTGDADIVASAIGAGDIDHALTKDTAGRLSLIHI